MNHLMIDLETLDIIHSAVVFQAGVTIFNEDGSMPVRRRFDIDVLPQIMAGRTMEKSTQEFWMGREKKIWERSANDVFSVETFFLELSEIVDEWKPRTFWANSPSFDMVILRSLAKDFDVDLPWDFRQDMDMRTLKQMFRMLGHHFEPTENSHNALDDTISQASMTARMMKDLMELAGVQALV